MDQLDEIRSKIDIVQLISEYLPLQKSGRNFKALCPFHAEKSPSFIVSPERQIFKCFGCGKGGSVFNFLMEMEGMEFGEALRILAKRAGVELVSYRPGTNEAEKEKLYQINHLTSEFYHYLLLSHSAGRRALDYLLGRGIKRESMALFKLGYAPSLWEGLQKFLVGKRGYKTEDLFKLGLITRQATGFRDFFRDRIIFPLPDHRGHTLGFAGRVIGSFPSEEAARIGPKYINTPESLLYHKSELLYGLEMTKNEIKTQNQAVVVEGELDLISSYQIGIKNIVAIKGSAISETQGRLLKRFTENLVLALDMDVAGDQASRRGFRMADFLGLSVRVARLPQGKDPDELAQKNPELLKKTVKEAIPVYDFLIESAFGRFGGLGAEGKRKIGQEIVPVLNEISDEIVKNHYVRLLAQRLGVLEESILSQMAKMARAPAGVTKAVLPTKPSPKTRREILEEYLLALLFQAQQPFLLLEPQIKKALTVPAAVRIVFHLEEFLGKRKQKFASEKFVKILPPELVEIFNHFYLFDFGQEITKNWFEKEKEKVLKGLEEINLREKIEKASREMGRLEKEGKEEEVEEAKKSFRFLSQKLGKIAKGA